MATKRVFKLNKNDGFYMPLFNLKGLKSSISPFFAGDLKLDQHHYALEPTTEVDLYHPTFSRNIVFQIDDQMYFLNGQTQKQQADEITYETDLLYQKVTRKNEIYEMITTSYIPTDETAELHEIILTNRSNQVQKIKVTTATPIYARSADNLRDHRHVTSLLNQIKVVENAILVDPTLSFDERGHTINHTTYSLLSTSPDLKVAGYIPVLDDYMNGGSLHFPRGLNQLVQAGTTSNGYEAIGAIAYQEKMLNPNETITLYMAIGIHSNQKEAVAVLNLLNQKSFHEGLNNAHQFFLNYVSKLAFSFESSETSNQLSWVVLQPMLRRYFGNSYLPHHDYGHGGRGWRDLWQDLLSLIMMNDASVKDLLLNNFQGVRIDGSNATIIGDKPGEFKADRNMITRVWSDHGAWPLLTTKMYIDETGDIEFLLLKQYYFKDQFTHYTKKTRIHTGYYIEFSEHQEPYQGTILEHLLLQNLVGYHNIGKNGYTRLEDADWNDGLDMAHDLGETIAFTHMYASNLLTLSKLISSLQEHQIEVFEELLQLFKPKANIQNYFDSVKDFKGKYVFVDRDILSKELAMLAQERIEFLNKNAFKENVYQSYIDNDGKDPDHHGTLSLTGQTMALLSQTPSLSQAKQVAKTTKDLLFEKEVGGYHLNSNYHQILTNMGRAYGFAYGHKENGAIFSHMVMMYAYGLYQYNLVSFGREALMTLLKRAQDKESKVPLGIPEYFTDRGIGKYLYLTGSAAWLLKLLRTEIFGIQFNQGELFLEPKLSKDDFINGVASIDTYLHERLTKISYFNPKQLDYNQYTIKQITINGRTIENGFKTFDGDIEVHLDEIL
jgi:cellobiose phosphorylase